MKCRIRKTGEIVEVISYSAINSTTRSSSDYASYIDSKGEEHEKELGLNYYWDFEQLGDKHDIDWEQVRISAAITAMQSYISNNGPITTSDIARFSVQDADALIAELKK